MKIRQNVRLRLMGDELRAYRRRSLRLDTYRFRESVYTPPTRARQLKKSHRGDLFFFIPRPRRAVF